MPAGSWTNVSAGEGAWTLVAHPQLAVEHVQPKSKHPRLLTRWSNFLLACWNCNSIKGKKRVRVHGMMWPDRDNTYRALAYDVVGGGVSVSPALPPRQAKLARETVALV